MGTTETDGQPDWDQLRRQLTAFVARRVSPEATDDVVQQTLLAMYSGLPSLEASDRLDAWAFQIARNAIADHHRRRAADGRRADAVAVETSTQPPPMTPELTVEPETHQELATCVSPLLGRLPGPYREAITLADIRGLTQASAAEQLNLSVPGMKSRVQRGREKLRAMLLECCDVEFDMRGGAVDYRLKSPDGGWCSCPDEDGSTDTAGSS